MLKSKIHRAVVTQADLNYVGSITIDSELMEAAGIVEYELIPLLKEYWFDEPTKVENWIGRLRSAIQ